MAQLTHKELMLLQDNISMCQDMTEFLQNCMDTTHDVQLKNICSQMFQEHKQDAQRLASHITQMQLQ